MEATTEVINSADAPDRAACRVSHPLNRILRHYVAAGVAVAALPHSSHGAADKGVT